MPSNASSNHADIASLLRKVSHVRRWPRRDIPTTGHAVVVIVMVEILIRLVSLPRLSRRLGVPINLEPAPVSAAPLPLQELPCRAQRRLRCTGRVADVWPFSKGPCLRRALVGGHLLRDLDPTIRLGLAGTGDTLLAHAWLEIGGRPLESVGDFARFERAAGRPVP